MKEQVMNQMMGRLVLILLLATGGIAMASELTPDEQIKQLEDEIKLLQKKTELLTEQKKLMDKKAEIDSAELKEITTALSDLKSKLPKGNEGTIAVSAGQENTALLRSKRPMLELLNEVADTLVKECSEVGTVLMTEEQLKKAYTSIYTNRLIDEETGALDAFNRTMVRAPADQKGLLPGALLLGDVLGLVQSVSKLFRVDRELAVFNKEGEAEKLLKHLLDSKKGSRIVTSPEELAGNAEKEAETLWKKRTKLSRELETAKTNLEHLNKMQDVDVATVTALETNIKQASSLLETLDKDENFWAQVEGQLIASTIEGKDLLFLETHAQTVQVKESRWYAGDRILAVGEVQVLYRLLGPDGSVKKSGIILKSSGTDNMRLDKLEPINWSKP